MRLRGLCTTRDGGVVVIVPAAECVETLVMGGGIETAFRWREGLGMWLANCCSLLEVARCWLADEVPIERALAWEAEKFIRDPHWRPDRTDREHLALKWVMALHAGGLSEWEAVGLILQKDAPAWSVAHEIVDRAEIPRDRTYRDAWRRSANGGPIWVDITRALEIDEARIWDAYAEKRA